MRVVQTGTPVVNCYAVREGKESDSVSLPLLCEGIFRGMTALDLGKLRNVSIATIAPDLMLLDCNSRIISWYEKK